MELASVNGEIIPLKEAKVSVLDRGFLFGDGIYEVLRVYSGKPFLLEEHFTRLERSLKGLQLSCDIASLKKNAQKLLSQSQILEATLYIQVTRGVRHTRQHIFSSESPVPPGTEVLFVTSYNDEKNRHFREKGARAITFPDIRWGRVDLKTTNLLGNVLAAEAAKSAGVYEAIFVNEKGLVTEGSHTNVFAICNGKLRTYPLNVSVLPGVTRASVLQIAKNEGVPIEEKPLTKEELLRAEEVFVSATTAEIMPIIEVDGVSFSDSAPGPTTRAFQKAYSQLIQEFRLSQKVTFSS